MNINKNKDFALGGFKSDDRIRPKNKQILSIFNLKEISGFVFGCLVLWIITISLILNGSILGTKFGTNKNKNLQALQKILPDVEFKNAMFDQIVVNASSETPSTQAVLGVSEKKNGSNTDNPYSKYENVSELYETNPELVKKLEKKISDYIDMFRSYEAMDQRFDVPVPSIVFLEVSLKYQVPLSYTLAVARLESRFGTDCFTETSSTRICKHKNIYSLGLDDSGGNWTFPDWEAGVFAFGKWYQNKVDSGYSTCRIWRTYNPNGDYCKKVLDMSLDIEKYFKE